VPAARPQQHLGAEGGGGDDQRLVGRGVAHPKGGACRQGSVKARGRRRAAGMAHVQGGADAAAAESAAEEARR